MYFSEFFVHHDNTEKLQNVEDELSRCEIPFCTEPSNKGILFRLSNGDISKLRDVVAKFSNSSIQILDLDKLDDGWCDSGLTGLAFKNLKFSHHRTEAEAKSKAKATIWANTDQRAFGDGCHVTTQMMLQQIDSAFLKWEKLFSYPIRVLDLGTGNGVLASAVGFLSKQFQITLEVDAVDCDDYALTVAAEMNSINGLEKIVHLSKKIDKSRRYQIVMCNIQPPFIFDLVPEICDVLQEKGILLLSGFTDLDKGLIQVTFKDKGFELTESSQSRGWHMHSYKKLKTASNQGRPLSI